MHLYFGRFSHSLFFSYKNMKPDELFWENVRRAELKPFVAGASFSVVSLLALFYRSSIAYIRADVVQPQRKEIFGE